MRNPVDPRFKTEVYGGPYSFFSAWHLKGRFEVPQARKTLFQRLFVRQQVKPAPKPRLPAVALCSKLPRDEAWALARRYVQGVRDVVANPFVVDRRMRLPRGGWQAVGRGRW